MNKIDITENVKPKKKQINVKGICGILVLAIVILFFGDMVYRKATRTQNIEDTSYVVITDETQTTTIDLNSPTNDDSTPSTTNEIDTSIYNVVTKTKQDLSLGALAIINVNHPTNFPDISSKLSDFYSSIGNGYKMANFNIKVCEDALEPFNSMMNDFYTTYNINYVTVVDGYIDQSTDTSNGTSDNNSGYAVNFKLVTDSQILDFDGTGDYSWIEENCYKYGFILRYPEKDSATTGYPYTPNHFRYVGIPHSNIMQDKELCLEDYIEFLKTYDFYSEHLYLSISDMNYEIYYVKAEDGSTDIPVPKDKYYIISGNNIDGFIVTVIT
ncbi:MAG: D-alanyl-D-alanine carboxypeptidase family protein [Oscillospiraceae bacterium]